ncbi:MAG: alpha/beta hydrolase [Actinomycetota bacterium]|nr:MAG: alpha/beta hydrolase [Actinomycetota bacterium]
MESAVIDGIYTRYEVIGTGPPVLMFSPGGFDSALDNWRTFSIYRRLNLLDHLSTRYTCIIFDRRESGSSGGRVERISWDDYARQGKGLLDHLGLAQAHLMGGCVGCSSAATLAVSNPEIVLSMVLFSPAGGPKYRMNQHARLYQHMSYVVENGLDEVVRLAKSHDKSFSSDPRVGPWVTVIRRDQSFAESYAQTNTERYLTIMGGMARALFNRDAVPGPEPEDLMQLDIPALVVPGQDQSHATSAARYLEECLPESQYWDVPVSQQTEETAPPRILEFLDSI